MTFRFDDIPAFNNRLFTPPGLDEGAIPVGLRLNVTDVQLRVANLISSGLSLAGKDVTDGQPTQVGMLAPNRAHILDPDHIDDGKLYDLNLQIGSQVPMLHGAYFGQVADRIAVLTENKGNLVLPDGQPILAYQNLNFGDLQEALAQLMFLYPDRDQQIKAMATSHRDTFWTSGIGSIENFTPNVGSTKRIIPRALDTYRHQMRGSIPRMEEQTYDIALAPLPIQGETVDAGETINMGIILYHEVA